VRLCVIETFSERPLNLQNCFYESSTVLLQALFRYIFSHIYLFSSYLIFILKSRNSAVKAAAVKTAKRAVFLFPDLLYKMVSPAKFLCVSSRFYPGSSPEFQS